MRKWIVACVALSLILVSAAAGTTQMVQKFTTSTVTKQCVYIDMRPGQTHGDLSVLPKFKTKHCIVGKRGPAGLAGDRGPAGVAGTPGPAGPKGATGAPGAPGTPAPAMTRLTGPFAGTNATVATSLDGVQFGPYSDGGSTGGSVLYTGANGLTLDQITALSFTEMHSSANDSPISTPYLRIFLDGDTHDVIFDPTHCATVTPAEDTFNSYEVVGNDVRYDDDSCDGVPPDQQSWDDVVAAHADEVVSGIYVTTGFTGGNTLAAILRNFSVNGTGFTFGQA